MQQSKVGTQQSKVGTQQSKVGTQQGMIETQHSIGQELQKNNERSTRNIDSIKEHDNTRIALLEASLTKLTGELEKSKNQISELEKANGKYKKEIEKINGLLHNLMTCNL